MYKQNSAFCTALRMDPADEKCLQRQQLKLLDDITHYQRMADGLFAKGILTTDLKEKVVGIISLYLSY